jgi:hypothetical protein
LLAGDVGLRRRQRFGGHPGAGAFLDGTGSQPGASTGTIAESCTGTIAESRAGTIAESRAGTIAESRAGTIAESRAGTIRRGVATDRQPDLPRGDGLHRLVE